MGEELHAKVCFTKMLTQKRKKWDDGIAIIKHSKEFQNRYRFEIRDLEGTIVENSIYKSEEGVPPVGEDLRVGKLIVNIDSYDSGSTEEKKEEPPPPPPRTLVRPIRTAGANRFVAPRSIPLHQTRNSPEKQSPERTHVPHLNVQVQPSPIKSSQPVITVPEEPPKTILVKPRTFDEILNFYSDNPSPLDQFKVTKSINEITLTHETNLSSIKESMQDGTKRKRPDESLSYEDFPVDPNTDFKSPQRTTGYESTDVNQTKDNIIAISWGGKLAPKVPTVPFEFECLDDYKTAFLDGISYELNYKINEVYKMYVAALFSASNKAPRCKAHGPAAFNVDKKGNYYYKCKQCNFYQPIQPDIITPSRRDVRSIATVINFMHVRNISYHESTLIRKNNVYTLYFSDDKLDNVEYSKDDLWVIFSDHISPIFVVSESYGVSQRNRLEITPFFNNRLIELPMQIKVTSIRLFNVQSEKLSISKLFSLDESSLPILPVLLNNNQQNVVTNDFLLNDKQIEEIRNIAEEISNEYHLNEYQKLSLMKVIDFFHPNTATPLLLIHGIFGAGKSKLLSIIIIFIDRILKLLHLDDQVLIASSTNVAVDNILNNLIEYEFEDFTRVGSVKKIKKNLLPYVTGHGNDEAISELHLIISETDNSERSVVQRALENAQNEYNQKKSKIDSVRVVGATCAATSFSVMSNKKFSFVILDECSQQTEPVSLLPISFGCKRLICAGDPLQLPPTLSKSAPNGYGRPLFSRVSKRFPPVMLQTQYRCHPSIADICSCLFYKGMVKNGVTEDDRRPVLETLPTMCLFDVKCGAEQYRGGSICNAAEAITVVNLVKYLVDAGISARDIGVIAFYKAQVELICEGLTVDGQRKRTIVDVSTVDAFQGDEREVVIITTAKTKKTAFVDSPERVNVAVSRARRHLFVVSNVRPLIESELWNTLFARACRAPNKRIALENAPDTGWRPF